LVVILLLLMVVVMMIRILMRVMVMMISIIGAPDHRWHGCIPVRRIAVWRSRWIPAFGGVRLRCMMIHW
jgi:hypothetical protein